MPVSYLICAAGRGTRTAAISSTKSKPLLKLKGLSLLHRSIESLPIEQGDQLIILHSLSMSTGDVLNELVQWKNICEIKTHAIAEVTRGQLETAYLGFPFVPSQNSVAIFNSDTFFRSSSLLPAIKSGDWDGLIPCGQESGDAWSFCQVLDDSSDTMVVTDIAEKKRISEWCSVGFYWFRSRVIFEKYARLEMDAATGSQEIFVAPMYRRLISDKLRIGMNRAEQFLPMGSVEQIQNFWGLTLEQMQLENKD